MDLNISSTPSDHLQSLLVCMGGLFVIPSMEEKTHVMGHLTTTALPFSPVALAS